MTESSATGSLEADAIGPVQMVVPAEPGLSRVIRLAASGLASLTGFTVDDIENITIAVSEIMVALVEHGNGSPVLLDFAARDRAFVMHGRSAVDEFDPADADLELTHLVLADVSSDHGMRFADGHAEIWATVMRTD